MSADARRNIVDQLKVEGFSEVQLDEMPCERVWTLYLDSIACTLSDEIGKIGKMIESNPQLASSLNPVVKKSIKELDDLAESLEKRVKKDESGA